MIEAFLTINNGTTYKITNLKPYTVYSFRILAVNGMGASVPSKESYYMVTLREGEYIFTVLQKKRPRPVSILLDFASGNILTLLEFTPLWPINSNSEGGTES